MAHAIVVLARVTPWAPRAELFGKIPIFFVILVGFGACLFCCCKVPGMYRSCRDTYNEGDDVEKDEDEDEDGEKRVSRHRPGRERQKQRGGKRERQKRGSSEEKEAWWHKSASQLSQHFGGENPMAAQRLQDTETRLRTMAAEAVDRVQAEAQEDRVRLQRAFGARTV